MGGGGYGKMGFNGKKHVVHRLAYEFKVGPIPPGMDILHKCDNTICVNPAHLFPGTARDNIRDAINKGRWRPSRGEKNGSAKLKTDDVYTIRRSTMKVVELAKRFGVTTGAIYHIKSRFTWRHLPPGPSRDL